MAPTRSDNVYWGPPPGAGDQLRAEADRLQPTDDGLSDGAPAFWRDHFTPDSSLGLNFTDRFLAGLEAYQDQRRHPK